MTDKAYVVTIDPDTGQIISEIEIPVWLVDWGIALICSLVSGTLLICFLIIINLFLKP